jgi:hypothetical protein
MWILGVAGLLVVTTLCTLALHRPRDMSAPPPHTWDLLPAWREQLSRSRRPSLVRKRACHASRWSRARERRRCGRRRGHQLTSGARALARPP